MKKKIESRDVAKLAIFVAAILACMAILTGEFRFVLAMAGFLSTVALAVVAIWRISRTAFGRAVDQLVYTVGEAIATAARISSIVVVTLVVFGVGLALFFGFPGLAMLWAIFITGSWIVKRVNQVTDAAQAHGNWARRN